MSKGQPVVRAASPKGPKITDDDLARWNAAAAKTEQLSDKMDDVLREVEEIDKLRGYVQEMQAKLGDFVVHQDFQKTKNDLRNLSEQVNFNKEDVEELKKEVEKIKDFIDKLHFPSMDDFKMMRSR